MPGNYIFECLDSLYIQTLCRTSFEVLIVLNGPKDPFYDMLLNYVVSSGLSNTSVLYSEPGGVSRARNLALDHISSKYVVFIDDDDLITPNYLESLYRRGGEDIIVVSNVRTFRDNPAASAEDYISKSFRKLKNDQKYNAFKYRRFLSSACCKIIPMKVIGNKRFNCNFKIGEDCLFIFSISDRIKKITLSEEDVIYYRRLRDHSATRKRVGNEEIIWNGINAVISYTKIYLHNPFHYNALVYLSRVIATLAEVYNGLKAGNRQFQGIVRKSSAMNCSETMS
jgi:glycosyltransferase involved in cell wall biosynthesis